MPERAVQVGPTHASREGRHPPALPSAQPLATDGSARAPAPVTTRLPASRQCSVFGDRAPGCTAAPRDCRPRSVTLQAGPEGRCASSSVLSGSAGCHVEPDVPYVPVAASSRNYGAVAAGPQIISPAGPVASVVMIVTVRSHRSGSSLSSGSAHSSYSPASDSTPSSAGWM
jgi:hypothetical protein